MEKFVTILAIFLMTIAKTQCQQRFAAGNPMCQIRLGMSMKCPNTAGLSCCMYPELFLKKIKRECKNNALAVTNKDGSTSYYEDSCFITCLFKNSGFNPNTNITADFFKRAIPANSDVFKSYIMYADETLERCKYYYGYATRSQEFSGLYRKALNRLDPKRPLCNMKLAAVWDCYHMWLMEQCPFLIPTDECTNMQNVLYRCYTWGSE